MSVDESMRKHLNALYSYAQILTLDTRRSSDLVEQTLKHAIRRYAEKAGEISRIELFQLMSRIHRNTPPPLPVASQAQSRQRGDVAHRFINQYLDTAMPAAFASLNTYERTLLTLCDVEKLSCADAAHVLDQDSDTVCGALERAREVLRHHLVTGANPAEKIYFRTPLKQELFTGALQRFHRDTFSPVPPTLEPRFSATLENLAKTPGSRNEPAGNRPPRPKERPARFSVRQVATGGLLIILAGLIGYIGTSFLNTGVNPDLIALSGRTADDIAITLPTNSIEEAEAFITTHLDRNIDAPEIQNGSLLGVGLNEIIEGVNVPVLLYSDDGDPDNKEIALFVYDYALLDRFADRLELQNEVWTQIADEAQSQEYPVRGDQQSIIWRKSNDIYMAFTNGDASLLQQRLAGSLQG